MRTLLFTLMLSACSLAVAATVYKWVDEDGVVHYSDQPHPNAQKLQLQAVQTYKAPPAETAAAAGGPQAPPTAAPSPYLGCAIVQPQDGQAFADIDALTIVVQTDPVLRPGDQVFLSLDGQLLNGGQPVSGSYTLTPVERGTHTVQAVVRGSDGAVMCQTPGITFDVHQPSLLSPVNPVHPRPH
jgi:hypothetical protein